MECKTCKWYFPLPHNSKGECRLDPPKKGNDVGESEFVTTEPYWYCSHYEKNIELTKLAEKLDDVPDF